VFVFIKNGWIIISVYDCIISPKVTFFII